MIRGCPNGETQAMNAAYPWLNAIGHVKPTRGSETSQYPQEEKAIRDSLSSGERNGMSLNRAAVKPVGVGSTGL